MQWCVQMHEDEAAVSRDETHQNLGQEASSTADELNFSTAWHVNAKIAGFLAAAAGFILVLVDDLLPRYKQGLSLFGELSEVLEFVLLCPGLGILVFLSTQYVYQREFDLKLKIERLEARRFVALGRIAGSIAHEVRNPLHNIKLVLEELREQSTDEQADLLKHLDDNVERINLAVKMVYELAKPAYHMEDELVNNIVIKAVLERALEQVRSEFDVSFILENISPDMTVVGHASSFLLAFENVLRNAAQCCEGEANEAGVTIMAYSERQHYRISVVNKGQLPKELLVGDAETFTSKSRGLGLGLYITKHLLERMQGQLKLEQREDQAIVSFVLQKGVHYDV